MNATYLVPRRWAPIVGNVAGGIGFLTLWFFLWLGLLQSWELSRLFPFEGLTPPLLVLSAWIVLNERVPTRAWLGIILIGLGVGLVAQT